MNAVIDLSTLRGEFPALDNVRPLAAAPSGQKEVLRATKDGRDVVLKLIKPGPKQLARADREIAAVARLECDFVPRILEHGKRDIGGEQRYFLIEEFIDGETYRQRLTRAPVQSIASVLHLARGLLVGCVEFEAKKMVHRDIKPENIMVDSSGKIWLIDFGIVRLLDAQSLTATSDRLGPCTLGYGAPEQLRNLKDEITIKADLFSVGVVLYEALAGENPFGAGRRGLMEIVHALNSVNVPVLNIPGDPDNGFAELIASLASRYSSRRPDTAREALQWFEDVEKKISHEHVVSGG